MLNVILWLDDNTNKYAEDIEQKLTELGGKNRIFIICKNYEYTEQLLSIVQGMKNVCLISDTKNYSLAQVGNYVLENGTLLDADILILVGEVDVDAETIGEMKAVLDLSERHGISFPRSNTGSGRIPYNEKGEDVDWETSQSCFLQIAPSLMRYTRAIRLDSRCFMVKKKVLFNCGGFPEKYCSLYNIIVGLGERIDMHGYNVMMSNHTWIKQEPLQRIDADEVACFENLDKAEMNYVSNRIDVIDYFSDVLFDNQKVKILFDMNNLPDFYNGTSEFQIALAKAFYNKFSSIYDITILANDNGILFHELDKVFPQICTTETITGNFHVAITIPQLVNPQIHAILNRHCLKVVAWIMDIIMLRCASISNLNMLIEEHLKNSFILTDGILTISKNVLTDLDQYFENVVEYKKLPKKPIYIAVENGAFDENAKFPFEDYVLVMGNNLVHKGIAPITKVACSMDSKNFIIVGTTETGFIAENVYGYKSGFLKPEFVEALYVKCSMLLFPSMYEGFGIPIVKALSRGKKVLLYETELNHELTELFAEYQKQIFFFEEYRKVPECIEKITQQDVEVDSFSLKRTWDDVADETEAFVREILQLPIDIECLRHRFRLLNYQLENTKHIMNWCNGVIVRQNALIEECTKKQLNRENSYSKDAVCKILEMVQKCAYALGDIPYRQALTVCGDMLDTIYIINEEVLGVREVNIWNVEELLHAYVEEFVDIQLIIHAVEKWILVIKNAIKIK